MKLDIYNDDISYVTDEVSSIPVSMANLNEACRAKFVTDLAAVSRGKSESKNPTNRYKMLLEEAAPEYKKSKGSPSRPLEFLPVYIKFVYEDDVYKLMGTKVNLTPIEFFNRVIRYSYVLRLTNSRVNVIEVLSNMRCLLNAGIPYENIPYNNYIYFRYSSTSTKHIVIGSKGERYVLKTLINIVGTNNITYANGFVGIKYNSLIDNDILTEEELNTMLKDNNVCYTDISIYNFKAIKAKIPLFVWAQVPMTHTAISKESQSDRVVATYDYWLPSDLLDKILNYKCEDYREIDPHVLSFILELQEHLQSGDKNDREHIISTFLSSRSQNEIQELLMELGYKKEIYNRAPYYFKYKEVVMTGWYDDYNTWRHLFKERSATDDWKNWTQHETKLFVTKLKEVVESSTL